MKVNKYIKRVVIVTFALGYLVSAVMAGSESRAAQKITSPSVLQPVTEAVNKRDALSSRWQVADVDSSMPNYFDNSQKNVINRAGVLTRVFDVLCRSGRPLRVLQLGDSHVAGGSYPQAIRNTLEQAWGRADNDSVGTGVYFRYQGSNGAAPQRFATKAKMAQVAVARPDLIILSFGTNECHGMGYNEELHRVQLEDFYEMLVETCPDAVILVTTPPGDYLSTRSVRYIRRGRGRKSRRVVSTVSRVNPMSVRCAAELEDFGTDHGLPVWDLNTIAGGSTAVKNWTAAHLMRPDRIHFTPEGYTLQGRLLGEAILTAYNHYLRS